ncbi:head-tail connector protein [Variovorax sp. EBFNA2]|uniref:head-tail connector protein n=1 Tax=Variovorax sp. EBFNA2 TaxID=3342097 RepID=UPI0029C0E7EA|nr:head-tail connector protein [Variovorax boronicumulans]WPG35137.1 head-tail connector protein [Variovorax boronicumulans]
MSITPLADVKAALRYIHSADDVMLQKHLDASESEICRFLNRTQLPTLPQDFPPLYDASGVLQPEIVATPANVAPEVFPAVCLLVQAKVDAASPEDIPALRKAAEGMVMPYRVEMGI